MLLIATGIVFRLARATGRGALRAILRPAFPGSVRSRQLAISVMSVSGIVLRTEHLRRPGPERLSCETRRRELRDAVSAARPRRLDPV